MLTGLFLAFADPASAAASVPPAIYTDPARDPVKSAAMEVLHIPSGGVKINGVAYLAAGPGPHPTLVIMHGLPGNEKNLDLAQAVRRAGWNAVTFNYRGSWGSAGKFRFGSSLDDGRAVLAFVRANAAKLRADASRIAIAGHSMGGWVAAMTGEREPGVAGTILISAANMGKLGLTHAEALKEIAQNLESLAGTSPALMVAELEHGAGLDWTTNAAKLAERPLLVLNSDDGLAPMSEALAERVRSAGGEVKLVHVATDHGWSDRRIRLQSEVINWLAALPKPQ